MTNKLNDTQLQVLQYIIENYPHTRTLDIVDGMHISEGMIVSTLAELESMKFVKPFVGARFTRWMGIPDWKVFDSAKELVTK